MSLSHDVLKIDAAKEVQRITEQLRQRLSRTLRRRGLVIALSGGIDSTVTTALAARAVGPERVLVLLMPEKQSADETLRLSNLAADHFEVERIHEDISPILEVVGFYKCYDQAVRMVIPEYGADWKSKIVIPNILEDRRLNLFSVVAQRPDRTIVKKRLPLRAYLEIVAATSFKQRIRKMFEYYHADRLNYAVAGTPNRLEYDQGFFVKLGDGTADIKPIAHLYKTQVYQLAEYLGVPEEIRNRPPTSDTYSLAQGQDEFYFSLPYDKMDICLYAKNNDIPASEVSSVLDLTPEQVRRIYVDIDTKRATTVYQHLPPLLLSKIPEIQVEMS